MGAGSFVFSKNVLGDTMLCDPFHDVEIALYDIDAKRLEESKIILEAINKNTNDSRATITTFHGKENRKEEDQGERSQGRQDRGEVREQG